MKRILIVEDELAYLRLLKDQLEHLGYEVVTATNGAAGLDEVKKQIPDLILLDVRMPIMDGIQMLKELRTMEEGKSIKVIYLTNVEPDDSTIREVITNHPTYYLIKSDIELASLMAKVKSLVPLK